MADTKSFLLSVPAAWVKSMLRVTRGWIATWRLKYCRHIWPKILAELRSLSKRRYVPPLSTALIYAGLGDKERALEWLEKAFDDRSLEMIFLKVDPRFDPLRGDGRFAELLRRMGLPL